MHAVGIFFLISVLFLTSCQSGSDSDAAQKLADSLQLKEEWLNRKEDSLRIREQELAQREQKLADSLQPDSGLVVDPVLAGTWNVKMTCSETNCSGSAVGDTKTEQWILSYAGSNIMAQAMDNNKLIRSYSGFYKDGVIELEGMRAENHSAPPARMSVRLRFVDSTHLEGQREIVRESNCKIIYALGMEKQR